jgi:ASC-1-like (ASCH) protein
LEDIKRKSDKTMNTTANNYSEHVSEPWFTLIKLGLKTVEGRKNKGRFKEMNVGDIIEWKNSDFGERSFLTKIIGKSVYNTFEEYLETEGLDKCLPGIDTMEEGLNVYFKYFTKEDEEQYGVVAIQLEEN